MNLYEADKVSITIAELDQTWAGTQYQEAIRTALVASEQILLMNMHTTESLANLIIIKIKTEMGWMNMTDTDQKTMTPRLDNLKKELVVALKSATAASSKNPMMRTLLITNIADEAREKAMKAHQRDMKRTFKQTGPLRETDPNKGRTYEDVILNQVTAAELV